MTTAIATRRRPLLMGGLAGVAMPIVFDLLDALQAFLAHGYSQVAQPISALAIQPLGWIQNANFVLAGCLYVVFAVGLRHGIRPTAGVGPVLHGVGGMGTILLGLFPWVERQGNPSEPLGHTIGVFVTFLPAAVGLILISRPMSRDARWRRQSPIALASGIVVLVLFFGFGALAEATEAPLHAWMGLIQRMMVNVWFLCTFILGLRLVRLSRDPELVRSGATP